MLRGATATAGSHPSPAWRSPGPAHAHGLLAGTGQSGENAPSISSLQKGTSAPLGFPRVLEVIVVPSLPRHPGWSHTSGCLGWHAVSRRGWEA